MADVVVVDAQKQTRQSLTGEFKLSIVEWYCNNDQNILQTANNFKVHRKQMRDWKEKIRK